MTRFLSGICYSTLLAAFLFFGTPANSTAAVINGITWLEVDDTNSSVASGTIETDGFDGGGGDQTDNNWDYTTPFGVIGPGDSDQTGSPGSGTGMLTRNNTENPGALTLSIPGILDSGTVYTVYVDSRGASDFEGVEVSLDNSNWMQHTRNGADTNLDGTFDTAATTILGSDGSNNYYYVDAGIGTLTGVSDLTVYFREPTTFVPGTTSSEWQWSIIDAVGLTPAPLVIAEPASASLAIAALLVLALMGFRLRRART